MADTGRQPSRIVGVLGGMGPAATVDFYDKLTEHTPVERDQDHLRVVIWSDPTVPSRQDAIMHHGTDPTPWLRHGLATLVAAGAEVLVVPCNTVHPFLDDIVPDGIEFIHIVDVTIAAVRRVAESQVVAVLATNAALEIGLYQSALTNAGYTPIVPDAEQQQHLTALVERVKTRGVDAESARQLTGLLDVGVAAGAGTVVVGCTELSAVLAIADVPPGLQVVDPALELALAAIGAATTTEDR